MKIQAICFAWLSRVIILTSIIFLVMSPHIAAGACHVVTPTGSGGQTGADWSNAYAGLPGSLVRGDTYYLAAGNYGGYSFNTAESGTALITIKSATDSDNCTGTGWSSGLAGQAVFTSLSTNNGYVTFDGNGRSGLRSGYGMKLDRSTPCSGNFCWDFSVANDGAYKNVTIRYMELAGEGAANVDTHNETAIRAVNFSTAPGTSSGLANFTIQYCWIHDTAGAPIMIRGTYDTLVEHNLIENNYGSAANHAEGISDSGSINVTVRYNEFRNVQNTAHVTELNAGTVSSADNWQIYGNVFYETKSLIGNAPISCINGQQCTNWQIYNNTFDGISGNYGGVTWLDNSGGTPLIEDNLFFNVTSTKLFAIPAGTHEDYNTGLKVSAAGDLSGSHDTKASSASNPFVNDAADNWNLTGDTSTGLGAGLILSALFNLDPNGVLRGLDGIWDRGAYQYNPLSGSNPPPPGPPAPPTLLQAVVH